LIEVASHYLVIIECLELIIVTMLLEKIREKIGRANSASTQFIDLDLIIGKVFK
jgi:hypothetical protein